MVLPNSPGCNAEPQPPLPSHAVAAFQSVCFCSILSILLHPPDKSCNTPGRSSREMTRLESREAKLRVTRIALLCRKSDLYEFFEKLRKFSCFWLESCSSAVTSFRRTLFPHGTRGS